jgi:lipid-A-disaccharide synthase-like uncharacterized protein
MDNMTTTEWVWLGIGFFGQSMFFLRFFFQWLYSERQRQSVIPVVFWYFSIAGGITLLAYAIYRMDPVFIAGQSTGVFIYSRNLYFIHTHKRAQQEAALGKSDISNTSGTV